VTEIDVSYNPVIEWSYENQSRCPYKIGPPHSCRRTAAAICGSVRSSPGVRWYCDLYDRKVTKTLVAGSRFLVTEKEAYEGLQVQLELWEETHALSTTNCITCGNNVQGADINMAEYVSAIYNLARVTKCLSSKFSKAIDTMPYFKSLFPKGTSAALLQCYMVRQLPFCILAPVLAEARAHSLHVPFWRPCLQYFFIFFNDELRRAVGGAAVPAPSLLAPVASPVLAALCLLWRLLCRLLCFQAPVAGCKTQDGDPSTREQVPTRSPSPLFPRRAAPPP
jgi:hypothetical protein